MYSDSCFKEQSHRESMVPFMSARDCHRRNMRPLAHVSLS